MQFFYPRSKFRNMYLSMKHQQRDYKQENCAVAIFYITCTPEENQAEKKNILNDDDGGGSGGRVKNVYWVGFSNPLLF